MANLTSEEVESLSKAIATLAWLFPVVTGVIILVGVVGNILVIFTICRQKSQKAVTYYYIVNLAITDLAFLIICAPCTAFIFVNQYWIFGDFMCKLINFMNTATGLATCITLTAMTIDRYRAIMHPFKSLQSRSAKTAVIGSLFIWLGSGILSIPFGLSHEVVYVDEASYCDPRFEPAVYNILKLVIFFMSYLIPLLIISVCYTVLLLKIWSLSAATKNDRTMDTKDTTLRRKRRVTFMILIVIIVFAVTWAPLHFVVVWKIFFQMPENASMFCIMAASFWLSFSNSAINPFVYAFAGGKFRERFNNACPCGFSKSKHHSLSLKPISRKRQSGYSSSSHRESSKRSGVTGVTYS